jgi:hypothetical protein
MAFGQVSGRWPDWLKMKYPAPGGEARGRRGLGAVMHDDLAKSCVTIQVADLQAAENDFPQGAADAKQYGHRTTLATPLLREGNPIGVSWFDQPRLALLPNCGLSVVDPSNSVMAHALPRT